MNLQLLEIPGVKPQDQLVVKVRALQIESKSPALSALVEWKETEIADYKLIMKVIGFVGRSRRVVNESHVRRGSVERETFEARADRRHARLFFFYDGQTAIFTNSYWKNRGDQSRAFTTCEMFRQLYFANKPTPKECTKR